MDIWQTWTQKEESNNADPPWLKIPNGTTSLYFTKIASRTATATHTQQSATQSFIRSKTAGLECEKKGSRNFSCKQKDRLGRIKLTHTEVVQPMWTQPAACGEEKQCLAIPYLQARPMWHPYQEVWEGQKRPRATKTKRRSQWQHPYESRRYLMP